MKQGQGISKVAFCTWEVDKPYIVGIVGRRVDCLGRSIAADIGEESVEAVQRSLRTGGSETARLLVHKAVILLEPTCGQVVWP